MNAERILVVDDEPDICGLVSDILTDEGYQVSAADNAASARARVEESNYDLVLLDIWMPDEDGITLLKDWKSKKVLHCPVVMMSGHGTVETAVEATKFGAVDFVEKPLSMAKLLSTVKSALAHLSTDIALDRQRETEIPVGNSQLIKALKQRMNQSRLAASASHLFAKILLVSKLRCG